MHACVEISRYVGRRARVRRAACVRLAVQTFIRIKAGAAWSSHKRDAIRAAAGKGEDEGEGCGLQNRVRGRCRGGCSVGGGVVG